MPMQPVLSDDAEMMTLSFAPTNNNQFSCALKRETLFGEVVLQEELVNAGGQEEIAAVVWGLLMPWVESQLQTASVVV